MKNLFGILLATGALGAGAYFALSRKHNMSGSRLSGPTEVRELQLFCESDGELYRQQVQPIEKNLKKKLAKGIYDRSKAEKLWGYLADNCARKYTKEYGGHGDLWHKIFSTADRREVAKAFNDSFLDEHGHQERHGVTPGGRSR